MNPDADMSTLARAVKSRIRERFAYDVATKKLRSVFIIGSCAGEGGPPNDLYCDVDVHFLWNDLAPSRDALRSLGDNLARLCHEFEAPDMAVGWAVRDRHWKLSPDPAKRLRLGLHGTQATPVDHQRRAVVDALLGANMYRTCEVLLGDHPGEILPLRLPSCAEYLYGVGGTSWVLENFYRALWLHFSEPDRFFTRIGEYAWGLTSSIMLHFYTVHTGLVGSRARALEYLMDDPALPVSLANDARHIHTNREHPVLDKRLAASIVNAASRVSAWMIGAIECRAGLGSLKRGSLPSVSIPSCAPVGRALGEDLNWRDIHVWFEPVDDLYEQFRRLVAELSSRVPHPTSLERPEFIQWAIENHHREAGRLYFWTPLNALRYQLSDDFAAARGATTLASAVWSWESGAQAMLQRLHERAVMVGADDPMILQLGSAFCALASDQLQKLGLSPREPPRLETGTFEAYQGFLAECVRPHTTHLGHQTSSSGAPWIKTDLAA